MPEIITLLFDEYTKNLHMRQAETGLTEGEAQYQQLRKLVGDEAALDIWDAAVARGAIMQEVCLKAGLMSAQELRSL